MLLIVDCGIFEPLNCRGLLAASFIFGEKYEEFVSFCIFFWYFSINERVLWDFK
jgi:hypothetical protein